MLCVHHERWLMIGDVCDGTGMMALRVYELYRIMHVIHLCVNPWFSIIFTVVHPVSGTSHSLDRFMM